jgi:hypothetical protein
MVIWSRWGLLVVVILVAGFVASQVFVSAVFQDQQYYQSHAWPKAAGAWAAAVVLWPLGRYMNRVEHRQLWDLHANRAVILRTGGGHTLFFLPMEYWSILCVLLGVALLFMKTKQPV